MGSSPALESHKLKLRCFCLKLECDSLYSGFTVIYTKNLAITMTSWVLAGKQRRWWRGGRDVFSRQPHPVFEIINTARKGFELLQHSEYNLHDCLSRVCPIETYERIECKQTESQHYISAVAKKNTFHPLAPTPIFPPKTCEGRERKGTLICVCVCVCVCMCAHACCIWIHSHVNLTTPWHVKCCCPTSPPPCPPLPSPTLPLHTL